ncbi:hypothetical protein AKJ16_DCAP13062 [Drosera capensis]
MGSKSKPQISGLSWDHMMRPIDTRWKSWFEKSGNDGYYTGPCVIQEITLLITIVDCPAKC